MATNYQQPREDVARTVDEAPGVIRTLAEILADKNGRVFVPRLERESAELCIETLDHVSHDPHPLPSDGLVRVSQGTGSRQLRNRFPRHIEKTRRMLWKIATNCHIP